MSLENIIWEAKGLGTVKIETIRTIFINEIDSYPYNTVMSGGVHELISATVDG